MHKSEYELMVEKRIAENKKRIKEFLTQFQVEVKDENIVTDDEGHKISTSEETPVEKKRHPHIKNKWLTRTRVLPRRSCKIQSESCDVSLSDKMLELPENEDESYQYVETPRKRRRTRVRSQSVSTRVIPTPSEISEEELEKVADHVSSKVYGANGTTCHQCRQKTLDTKTICRNEKCIGIRGQFCGPCLRNRYGENVRDALKDPDWQCPCCRDTCNCSLCRTAAGLPVTGICIPTAIKNGFTNVKDYLQEISDCED